MEAYVTSGCGFIASRNTASDRVQRRVRAATGGTASVGRLVRLLGDDAPGTGDAPEAGRSFARSWCHAGSHARGSASCRGHASCHPNTQRFSREWWAAAARTAPIRGCVDRVGTCPRAWGRRRVRSRDERQAEPDAQSGTRVPRIRPVPAHVRWPGTWRGAAWHQVSKARASMPVSSGGRRAVRCDVQDGGYRRDHSQFPRSTCPLWRPSLT